MLFLRIPDRTQTTLNTRTLHWIYLLTPPRRIMLHIHTQTHTFIFKKVHTPAREWSARFIEHKVFECTPFSLRAPPSDLALCTTHHTHRNTHIYIYNNVLSFASANTDTPQTPQTKLHQPSPASPKHIDDSHNIQTLLTHSDFPWCSKQTDRVARLNNSMRVIIMRDTLELFKSNCALLSALANILCMCIFVFFNV